MQNEYILGEIDAYGNNIPVPPSFELMIQCGNALMAAVAIGFRR